MTEKLLLYADPHFSQSSSILLGKSNSFSGRLDSLIKSFEWIERIVQNKDENISGVICLGDFADKTTLGSEELTAIDKCHVYNHTCLVGNHCRSDKDGKINSVAALFKEVISEPTMKTIGGRTILFLPYNSTIYDLDKLSNINKFDVILSHNDLLDYDFGYGNISKAGYNLSDIMNHCELFINGHLHNGGWLIKDRVINLGALSGMNFSSCGGEWEPSIGILDLETLHLEIRENPYALRFKKLEFDSLPKLKGYLDNLPNLNTYVLQVKMPSQLCEDARKLIEQSGKVLTSRILSSTPQIAKKVRVEQTTITEHTSIYNKFREYLKTQTPKYNNELINKIIDEIQELKGNGET